MASKKKGIVWTEDDLRHFKAWQANVDRYMKRQGPRPRADQYDIFQTQPEVYAARTPVAGITALVEHAGTSIEDTPGGPATCSIYKVSEGTGRLVPLGYSVQVYNLHEEHIGGNRWVLVKQDALGVWWAEAPFPAPDIDETGTGTDIDEGPPCGSGSHYVYRYYCIYDPAFLQGVLKEYRQLVSFGYDSNGCLRVSLGAETFNRNVTCCDLACTEDEGVTGTTGTGTGTGIISTTGPCCTLPAVATQYTFTVAGITNGTCAQCALVNGTWTLDFLECVSDMGTWVGPVIHPSPCDGTGESFQWYLHCDGTNFLLDFQQGGGPVPRCQWALPIADWNPLGSNLMGLVSGACQLKGCHNNPTSISVSAA